MADPRRWPVRSGCDAVVHAAAVSVTEPGMSDAADANLRGTQLVVGGACGRGIRRISSCRACFDPRAARSAACRW
jgi:nucleoside-diphosphate-sugar epimerase